MTDIALREHLLNRFGYGGSPLQRAEYDRLGPTRWLAVQIDQCGEHGRIAKWAKSPANYQEAIANGTLDDGRKGTLKDFIRRSISDEPSLAAVLRDHWFNHFNIYAYMGIPRHQLSRYLNDAIMPSIVGRFSDMLLDTMKHPTMLQYLDNRFNHKITTEATITNPGFDPKTKFVGPNENYAREVLELHTVGAENHSQADVEAASRILTGVSSNFRGMKADRFEWRKDWHDTGDKLLLNRTFSGLDLYEEVQEFGEFLASRQETSLRIGRKLAQRFIGPMAHATTINAIAHTRQAAVEAAGTDLRAAIWQVANAPQMVDPAIFGSKFKPPHRFIVSAYRSLGTTPSEATLDELIDELVLLGDMPFFYGPPTGFPDSAAFWLTGDGMLARAQIARRISTDSALTDVLAELSVGNDTKQLASAVVNQLLPAGVSPQTRDVLHATLASTDPSQRPAVAVEVALSTTEFLEY